MSRLFSVIALFKKFFDRIFTFVFNFCLKISGKRRTNSKNIIPRFLSPTFVWIFKSQGIEKFTLYYSAKILVFLNFYAIFMRFLPILAVNFLKFSFIQLWGDTTFFGDCVLFKGFSNVFPSFNRVPLTIDFHWFSLVTGNTQIS